MTNSTKGLLGVVAAAATVEATSRGGALVVVLLLVAALAALGLAAMLWGHDSRDGDDWRLHS